MTDFIKIEDLSKSYAKVSALKKVNVSLEKGSQYVIRGASGSGKSTLLYLLAGLDRPSSGEIYIEGSPLSKMSDEKLGKYRNQFIGLVFQFHFLLPSMNCLDNILLPSRIGGKGHSSLKDEIRDLSTQMGVDHCLKKFPYELSGGEQQRINILRSISLKPSLILCDEPTGSLDSENSENVMHILKEVAEHNISTLIVVTHDDKVASKFSHELLIKDGVLL
jgi:lipoprotein-releasing system ATP-binding protein